MLDTKSAIDTFLSEIESLDNELRLREAAENSFYEFVKQAWHLVEGDKRPFKQGWHLEALCEHLEAVCRRDIRNLLINLPPRCGKSSIVCVLWPAWVWIKWPHEQFFFSAYSSDLSLRDSMKTRLVIESPWYQARWSENFQLRDDEKNKKKFSNDKFGYRNSTSTGGFGTGGGGTILVADDPNNAAKAESEAERQSTINWWSGSWVSRLNDFFTSVKVVVQQRVHELDISGHIMSSDLDGDWTRLILPMEYQASRKAKTIILPSTKGKIWQDPRKKEGELLWPTGMDAEIVRKLKNELGSEYRIAGQFQQLPSPASGGIIKKEHFRWWKHAKPPEILHTIQSWDTALAKSEDGSYSACSTWGVFNDDHGIPNVILLGVWEGRLEYPDLRRLIVRLYQDYRYDPNSDDIVSDRKHVPDKLLIEYKSTGPALISDLKRAGVPATGFNPSKHGDKIARVRLITHYIEGGRVWVPARAPDFTQLRACSAKLVERCGMFPNGESRDLVDTLSQALIYLKGNWLITHPNDRDWDDEYEGTEVVPR